MGSALVLYDNKQQAQPKPKMGRPQVYTSEIGQAICEKVKRGTPIEAACGVLGITRETFYNWKEEREEFLYMFLRAYAEAEEYFTSILYDATKHPVGSIEYKAALEWLKRQRRASWADTLDVRRIDEGVLLRLLQSQHEATTTHAAIEDGFEDL